MTATVERREADDPWHGKQPRYEAVIAQAGDRYALAARLPSGERILVGLGRPPEPPSRTEGCVGG